jgi:hypothetical protein
VGTSCERRERPGERSPSREPHPLEEQALDKLEAHDRPAARTLVAQSLAELTKSIAVVKDRIRSPSDPQRAIDVKLLAGLELVRAKKIVASHAACPVTEKIAIQALRHALELEYELAELADRNHKPL